jgi:uncharacterized SAM-binding protein YcdF (DUF218 family)
LLRRRRERGGRNRLVRAAAVLVAVAMGVWFGGLVWFASSLPSPGSPPAAGQKTDAIVVLTGGKERLATGLRLLAEGYAAKAFVSGVARGVDVATLLRLARRRPEELACCIMVGYAADNTAGNARETARWMRSEKFTSLRLVTAGYHMPRSLLEFRRAISGARIVPHPVFPPRFKLEAWWLWPGTASLIASEYSKFLLALLRHAMETPAR